MSLSAFQEHFRSVTSLSPLQFQKRLRLVEARRLLISYGVTASAAAFAFSYASAWQFSRVYGRVFEVTPGRDADTAREPTRHAA